MPHIMSAERIGMQKGMLTEARENVLEALDARFSKDVTEDVYKKVQALNNRILLKKLHKSAIVTNPIKPVKSFHTSGNSQCGILECPGNTQEKGVSA